MHTRTRFALGTLILCLFTGIENGCSQGTAAPASSASIQSNRQTLASGDALGMAMFQQQIAATNAQRRPVVVSVPTDK